MKNLFKLFSIFLLSFFIFSCSDIETQENISSSKVKIHFSIKENTSRTALPEFDFSSYTIKAKNISTSEEKTICEAQSSLSSSIEIEVGTYDFTLTAKTSNEITYEGTASKVEISENNANIVFNLSSTSTANGSFSVDLVLNDLSSDGLTVKAQLLNNNFEVIEGQGEETLSQTNEIYSFKKDVPTGNYFVRFTISKDGYTTSTRHIAVQVFSGLESSGNVKISGVNEEQVETVPEGDETEEEETPTQANFSFEINLPTTELIDGSYYFGTASELIKTIDMNSSFNDYLINEDNIIHNKYSFIGWNTKSDGTGISITNDTVVTEDLISKMETTDVDGVVYYKVYAQWNQTLFNIAYNFIPADGSDASDYALIDSSTYSINNTINLGTPEVETNYSFDGWYKNYDETNGFTNKVETTEGFTGDITLYGKIVRTVITETVSGDKEVTCKIYSDNCVINYTFENFSHTAEQWSSSVIFQSSDESVKRNNVTINIYFNGTFYSKGGNHGGLKFIALGESCVVNLVALNDSTSVTFERTSDTAPLQLDRCETFTINTPGFTTGTVDETTYTNFDEWLTAATNSSNSSATMTLAVTSTN